MAQGYTTPYIATAKDLTVQAGEDISAYSAVRIVTADEGVTNLAFRTIARNDKWVVGVALNTVSSGGWVVVRIFGIVTGFNNLVPGELYCVDSVNPGGITRTSQAFPYTNDFTIMNYENAVIGLATSQNSLWVNSWNNTPITNTKGYVYGGYNGSSYIAYGTVINYATDVGYQMMYPYSGYLHYVSAGLSNIGYKGYVCGGVTAGSAYIGNCDVLFYATEAWLGTACTLPAGQALGGVSEGKIKGYVAGGYNGSYVATTRYITYATDVTSTTVGAISVARFCGAGVSEGKIKGYFCGGNSASSADSAVTDRIMFISDSVSAVASANLSQAREGLSGLTDGMSKGLLIGGYAYGTGVVSTADKLVFATDVTAAQTTANLTAAKYGHVGVSEGTKGYSAGGVWQLITDKTVMATEITSRQNSAACYANGGYGQGFPAGFSEGMV